MKKALHGLETEDGTSQSLHTHEEQTECGRKQNCGKETEGTHIQGWLHALPPAPHAPDQDGGTTTHTKANRAHHDGENTKRAGCAL